MFSRKIGVESRVENSGEHTSIPYVLVGYWHRTSRTVHPVVHAGIHQRLVARMSPVSSVGRSLPAHHPAAGSRPGLGSSRSWELAEVDIRRIAAVDRHLDLGIDLPYVVVGSPGSPVREEQSTGRIDCMDQTC